MKNYVRINCPTDKLVAFLRRFEQVSHIAIAEKHNSSIHYLGFNDEYSVQAAKDFAKRNNCSAEDISRDEVIRNYHSDVSLTISKHSNFDPLQHKL